MAAMPHDHIQKGICHRVSLCLTPNLRVPLSLQLMTGYYVFWHSPHGCLCLPQPSWLLIFTALRDVHSWLLISSHSIILHAGRIVCVVEICAAFSLHGIMWCFHVSSHFAWWHAIFCSIYFAYKHSSGLVSSVTSLYRLYPKGDLSSCVTMFNAQSASASVITVDDRLLFSSFSFI